MDRVEPVESLGGSGFAFEDRVGTYLAAAMLADEPVIGGLGVPVRVDFQVKSRGWCVEDMLVWFPYQDRECRKWGCLHQERPTDTLSHKGGFCRAGVDGTTGRERQ